MKKPLFVLSAIIALALLMSACGGGGSGGNSGLNGAQSVTGVVKTASGDPVPGVTVYIPGVDVTASVAKATRVYGKATAPDGTVCEDPPTTDDPLAYGCTGADGTYTLDTSTITSNPMRIVGLRGGLRTIIDLNCEADTASCSTNLEFGSSSDWPKVAVVTGNWDRMEDMLAKLADSDTSDNVNGSYGRVDSLNGTFVYGSEYGTNLTIIDGTGFTVPTENAESLTYKTWDKYLDGTYPLIESGAPIYDIVFINCGNDYEATLTTEPVREVLRQYVNAGGRLYVTDLSYDFVEQPFPQVMQFENDPADPTTPGTIGAAEMGTSGLTLDAAINDAGMLGWLDHVSVNRHDASTPGNPEVDCTYSIPYEQYGSALTAADLIPTDDFLGGWAQMVGAHTGYSPTIWISSGAGVTFDGRVNRPLTVSMDMGNSGGKIFYSSYHTAHSCPTTTFWPQERVLQYLIFGAF